MSLNFTVQKVEDFQAMPDGKYVAQVDHIDYVRSDFGNYFVVNWKMLSPSEFEGRVHQERYNVEHENDQVRQIAINNFSRFCIEIGGLKEGDETNEKDFLYKIANITIRSRIGKKDGKSYSNVAGMQLVTNEKNTNSLAAGLAESGMVLPTTPSLSESKKEFINDEVPF